MSNDSDEQDSPQGETPTDAQEERPTGPPPAAANASKPAPNGDDGGTVAAEAEPAVIEVPAVDPLEEAKADAARYKDQLYRTAADLDNYRKRSKREVGEAEGRGRELMLKDLLPVFDNLERATAHADSVTEVQSLVDGISLVIRQFRDALGRAGIERIATTGTAFDPAIHEAIQQIETAELEAGRVALEIQAGYRLGARLIRPALVAVAKAPPRKEPEPEPTDESSE